MAQSRKAMHRRLNAISSYKTYRKNGYSHSEAIEQLKTFGEPYSHIRKCDHSPFRAERTY
ncbi:hypothetical protein [Alteromonas mediterranea]|uniref:hypothetical protein n=1 Tax=Alteromonas mediterranea TaxID=314275 RepID=UPI000A451199|nr:hypothetical protein [Alteromonas mediterranea]